MSYWKFGEFGLKLWAMQKLRAASEAMDVQAFSFLTKKRIVENQAVRQECVAGRGIRDIRRRIQVIASKNSVENSRKRSSSPFVLFHHLRTKPYHSFIRKCTRIQTQTSIQMFTNNASLPLPINLQIMKIKSE